MSHEMPFKSWFGNFRGKLGIFAAKPYSWNFSWVSLTHETLYPKLKKLRIGPFYLWLNLHMNKSRKHPKSMFFTQKELEKLWKHGWYKSLPKENKKNKILFGLIHIWLNTHTSHLNMYNHTNEIDIHWTLDLCVVCVYQMWSP